MLIQNNTKGKPHIGNLLSYLFLPIFLFILLALAVFRPNDFASDYINYQQLFDSFKLSSNVVVLGSIEPMYIWLSKFVYFFDGGFLSLLFVVTFVSIFIKYKYAKALFIKPSFIFLYFCVYFLTFYPLYELTQLRVCLALSFVLYALVNRTHFGYVFFIMLAVLSHYSLAPCVLLLLATQLSRAKIKGTQVNLFITAFIISFFLLTFWFLKFLPDKYEGTNYPFYYYFLHPFSIIIIVLLVSFRRMALGSYSRVYTNIYYIVFLYYSIFAAFIISGNQIPAFRFLEISLFFSLNFLFIGGFIYKNKLSILLLLVEIFIVITFFHLIATNPLINFSVFKDYFSLSGV